MTKKKEGKTEEKKTEQKQEPPMEEGRLDFRCNAIVLQSIMNSIGEITDDAPFKISKDAITTTVVDAAHVAMLTLRIPARNFYHGRSDDVVNKSIQYDVNRDFEASFDVAEIKQGFLRILNPADKVTGYITPTEIYLKTDHLNKSFSAIEGVPEPKCPAFDNKLIFKIPEFLLPTFVKAIGEKEYVQITSGKDGIRGEIYGYATDERPLNFLFTKVAQDVEAKCLYSCDYLKKIFNATGNIDVKLKMDTDVPCTITTEYLDGGEAIALLAPRIESD